VRRKPSRLPPTRSQRTIYLIPSIPDELDEQTKNALAIRNAASTSGVCPDCGTAATVYRDRRHPRLFHAVFAHEPGCRCLTDGAAA
jgi:hypothetical protein